MPSQQQVQWSQLKVGVLVLVALSALTALVFLMSGSSGGFWTGKITVRSYFENSAGLKVGAPVNLEGVTIGNVKAVRIEPQRKLTPVEVTMKISKKFTDAVHQDSKSSLETIGVLGDTVVNIDSKFSTGPEIRDGDELKTTETPNLTDVIKSSQGTIEQLNTILAKVDNLVDSLNSGKGSIGQLINDPTLYNKAVLTVNQIQALVDSVASGKGSIGKLVADDQLYKRIDDTVGHLQHISAQLDAGQGSAGKLLKDETLYNNLKQSTDSLNQLLAGINQGKGAIGMMAKDPQFAKKLNDTVTNLNSVLAQVDSGEGTIGKLIKDPALYNHSDEMIQNTSNLVTAIRQNPKKYLTIHFKVF
ncbi:phospholipid/cholesterol/gamma-HCH transport system substrate-binding protein [Silvibacterium bohemicum]|uniref:Phospholipid/cholesterol/gamma-HCH transport system substrate-binding protein n=1 Tax=Silvibacterium bohemicum TaxID=1577686 RepID=A0A841JQQ4_9BACT|nr:MlaD family protein [Silvibacterium bohemicum]MBB6142755.1 phospholipid/cholesterol/gamma-HCH transport system substrate-binding protein [Silvibacterium bohemicum]